MRLNSDRKLILGLILAFMFLILGLGFSARASIPDVTLAQGQFLVQENDPGSWVKSQLIFSAFKNALTVEMGRHGLSADKFWKLFDERFEVSFAPTLKSLQERYHVGSTTQTAVEKVTFTQDLRLQRAEAYRQYLDLSKVIQSYAVKELTKSESKPNLRLVNLEVRIDPLALQRAYHSVVEEEVGVKVPEGNKKLFVTLETKLPSNEWEKMGYNNPQDLSKLLLPHWKKWLSEKLSFPEKDIHITDSKLTSLLLRKKEGALGKTVDVNKGPLWLTISLNLSLKQELTLLRKRDFLIGGNLMILDLGQNRPIFYSEFPAKSFRYDFQDKQALAQDVANTLLRVPLNELSAFVEKSKYMPKDIQIRKIAISGPSGLYDLMLFKEVVETQGLKLNLKLESDMYSLKESTVTAKYRGSDEDLKNLMVTLNQRRLSSGKTIHIPNLQEPLKLVLMGTETKKTKGVESTDTRMIE